MDGGFTVRPADVAGFSNLAYELSMRTSRVAFHVGEEARLTYGVSGLMEVFEPLVDSYAELTMDRISQRADLLSHVADELNRAAWVYRGTDESNSQYFAHHPIIDADVLHDRSFPDAARYPASPDPDLLAPAHTAPDIMSMVEEAGASLHAVEWVFEHIPEVDFSPTEAITDPLIGAWTELSRAGEVLNQAASAAESVALDLTSQLSSLDQHWEGGAAAAFADHVTRLATAIEQEGPLNRIVAHVYTAIASEIEKFAEYVISELKEAIDHIASAIGTSWVPGYGQYKIIRRVYDFVQMFLDAKDRVDQFNEFRDRVQEVTDSVTAAIKGDLKDIQVVQERLEALDEGLAQGKLAVEIGTDLAALADPVPFEDAPTREYHIGARPRRSDA